MLHFLSKWLTHSQMLCYILQIDEAICHVFGGWQAALVQAVHAARYVLYKHVNSVICFMWKK